MSARALFENRSGRVIALFRAILVGVFLIAVWIEPVATHASLDRGKVLLGLYLLVSVGAVVVAWRSWWFDQRLARIMLALDVLVFVASVFVTEAANADFTSPFLALFALAILSATLRWDWRMAALTGLAATGLFLLAGSLTWHLGLPIDLYRFGRRALYMMALLLVLVWFGLQRRDPHVAPLDLATAEGEGQADRWADLRWQALDYAMAVTGARRGVLAWSEAEEPWLDLHEVAPGDRQLRRLGPDALPGWDEGHDEVCLFDAPRQRKLIRDSDNLPRALPLRARLVLASHYGIAEGLALPLSCVSGFGVIVLGEITGPGQDFVTLGEIIAREVSNAFNRVAVLQFEREALLARTRGAIARDLHDSVAQSLAGACFRLEALRRNPRTQPAAGEELLAIREALRCEQERVRRLIDTLRSPSGAPDQRDLAPDLETSAQDAAMHWSTRVSLDLAEGLVVPGWYSHELQQLVREAVANAARHGHAGLINVRLARHGHGLALDIADDGSGFDAATRTRQPWSIRERVAALGGTLDVASGLDGTRLAIRLPARSEGPHR
ncbi:sensor histidine kinase [Novosphingobium piscinae]|uniref:Histidine kinase/HSP90-like ATPase domain-containing protein n=1 Tax=Novosphingobium piscinae TaxID=1507448 RepID=A0A7X1KRI0_9SPHN|nr:histidine kinase [Novosphingobium piscinae]MBC2670767.1 hypothetical protein [Novosphingobium piscinae]